MNSKRAAIAIIFAIVLAILGIAVRTVSAGDHEDKVTICHAAGLDGTTHYNTLTIGYPAVYGPAGHFYENGTPRAGHEQDYLGKCKPDDTTTTTSTTSTTTTTSSTTTTSTTIPTPKPFAVNVFAFCGPDFLPEISITFGNRPDLDGQTGVLSFSTGGSVFLVFQSNQTVTIPYPNTTQDVNLIYSLGQETATGSVTYPGTCEETTTTSTTEVTTSTTTTIPPTSTSTSSSSVPETSTTEPPSSSTTTSTSTTSTSSTEVPSTTSSLPETFQFGAAATVCVNEVPTIRIEFQNQFPSLSGVPGTLTMSDVNGNVVSTQTLTYEPGMTVDILYPGTAVNPDGSIDDVPGWILTDDGFWIRDPSDEYLRDGIGLEYTVNPTATAFVTYPPESSACANPDGPFGPPVTVPQLLPPTR